MTLERFAVRSCLTLIVVAISVCFAPFMLLLKLAEGVLLAAKITSDCLRQTWGEDSEAWFTLGRYSGMGRRKEDRV